MPQADAREKYVVNAVREELKRRGAFFFKSQGGGFGGVVGLPDFICCYLGIFVAIECKRPSGTHPLTPKQKLVLAQIAGTGGVAVVVNHRDQVKHLLADLASGEWQEKHLMEQAYDLRSGEPLAIASA